MQELIKFVGPLKSFANCRNHVKQPRVGIVKKNLIAKKLKKNSNQIFKSELT